MRVELVFSRDQITHADKQFIDTGNKRKYVTIKKRGPVQETFEKETE